MRHRYAHRKLGRYTHHRMSMLRTMCASLIQYEHVTTTEAKAKEVQPMVEKLITTAKRGDLHSRRLVLAQLYDEGAARKLFDIIAPGYALLQNGSASQGGYTRIYHIGFRKGDAAPLVRLELIPYAQPVTASS